MTGGSGAFNRDEVGGQATGCERCNLDLHACPACGTSLPHGVETCGLHAPLVARLGPPNEAYLRHQRSLCTRLRRRWDDLAYRVRIWRQVRTMDRSTRGSDDG